MKKEIHKIDYNLKDQISTLPALSGDSLQKMGSSAFLMGKFMQSSRNPLNPSKVFEKATHY
jgi:hypothetical protein